jgi:hypothetical protein
LEPVSTTTISSNHPAMGDKHFETFFARSLIIIVSDVLAIGPNAF